MNNYKSTNSNDICIWVSIFILVLLAISTTVLGTPSKDSKTLVGSSSECFDIVKITKNYILFEDADGFDYQLSLESGVIDNFKENNNKYKNNIVKKTDLYTIYNIRNLHEIEYTVYTDKNTLNTIESIVNQDSVIWERN